jgi:hypothetical protein
MVAIGTFCPAVACATSAIDCAPQLKAKENLSPPQSTQEMVRRSEGPLSASAPARVMLGQSKRIVIVGRQTELVLA